METTPVFLLVVCSASFPATVTSSHLRWFHVLEEEPADRTEAQDKCQTTQSNLTTVFDSDEADVIWTLSGGYVWLGLHRGQDNVSTWSDGVPYAFSVSTVVPSNGRQICEAIHNNTWTGFNCSDPKPFMCYKSSDYILVDHVEKDWCEARQYCRRHHTDLVSISNQTQNQEVMEKGNNRSFWIGLMHDEWEWQDGACSTYREWALGYPNDDDNYTAFSKWSKGLNVFAFGSVARPLCSRGFVKIKLIPERRTWEEAFEYCKTHHTNLLWIDGPEDQIAVEQWLNAADLVTGPMWLGLVQSPIFGFWFWTSDLVVNYTNWSYNNDINGPELPWSHQCGAINKNKTWSDVHCLFQLPFFCED